MKLKKTSEKIYENNGNEPIIVSLESRHHIVLDIGFGNGANARILSKKGHIVDGITLSPIEAEASKHVIRNIFIHNLEAGLPNTLNTKYDAVICSHVLEHIAYPEKLLSDIYNHLNDNGILIVALPNLMNYRWRWELLKGNFHSHETGIWDNTHLRWYTFKSGKDLFLSNSFTVKRAWTDGDLPWLTVTRIIPKSIRGKLYKLLTSISKGFFGVQLLYVLEKRKVM